MKRSKARDVIATNDCSIVSKRSAERLGYFNEEQFLRHFVTKPTRRAPLINVGYAIRSCIIDAAITRFLDECSRENKQAAVVNLGAGFDPSFFRIINTHTSLRDLTWIDADYPDLIARKQDVISNAPELSSFLNNFEQSKPCTSTSPGVSYGTIACDLCDTDLFLEKIKLVVPLSTTVLFVSEVATVYMPHSASDDLLSALAQTYSNGQYVCLEQTLPEGEINTAYSSTMMHHFSHNVKTPLRGTLAYPTLTKQIHRLQNAGWSDVVTETLLDVWRRTEDDGNLNIAKDRSRIISREPFDEWEELDLFLSHYYIGIAKREPLTHSHPSSSVHQQDSTSEENVASSGVETVMTLNLPFYRRGHTSTCISDNEVLIFGGFGLGSMQSKMAHVRLSNPTIVKFTSLSSPPHLIPLVNDSCPSPRMHHSACRLKVNSKVVDVVAVYGGRDGPQAALDDIWKWDIKARTWYQLVPSSRPLGRYRHVACPITVADTPFLFVHGGIGSDGTILDDTWLFDFEASMWCHLPNISQVLGDLHSAAIWCNNSSIFVHGGIKCRLSESSVAARLVQLDFSSATWNAESLVENVASNVIDDIGISRYGHAAALWCNKQNLVIMSGGIVPNLGSPKRDEQVVLVNYESQGCTPVSVGGEGDISRLLVQHTLTALYLKPTLEGSTEQHPTLVILGGGGTCFSFGSRFDTGALLFTSCPTSQIQSIEMATPSIARLAQEETDFNPQQKDGIKPVTTILSPTEEQFKEVVESSDPTLLRKLSIGPCQLLWSSSLYLKEKCGSRKVSVHVSKLDSSLHWHDKNFKYVMMTFNELIDRTLEQQDTSGGETVYLRSLSNSPKRPANFSIDFPELAQDFILPQVLKGLIEERFFSSPLRISGPDMRMWAHYDASDNILVQIYGRKLVRLWHPCDVDKLYIEGSSSLIPDIENVDLVKFPLFPLATPFEVILEPGDILFIPALWLHSVKCLSACISINIFFRSQSPSLYSAQDVWSNQDLLPFQSSRLGMEKVVEQLNVLPPIQKQFYLKKLGMSLISQAENILSMQ